MHVLTVPAHSGAQTLRKRHALAPPQDLELGAVDPIIVVVKGAVANPREAVAEVVLGAVAEQLEHAHRDLEVCQGEGGTEVIRFTHDAFVQERVEAVGCVRAVQVAPHVEAGALDCEWLLIGQEGVEAGDDFCRGETWLECIITLNTAQAKGGC